MRLELAGQPIHTRALSVVVASAASGAWHVAADILDLRKRGFTPVGSELQGAGIIHQMGLDAVIDGGVLRALSARQPVVAFEASAATRGESCRAVLPGLKQLVGRDASDAAAALRGVMGGAAGCSHLLAAAQLLFATLAEVQTPTDSSDASHRQLLRRDLLFDGAERADGGLAVTVQLSDLHSAPGPAEGRPASRFARHEELQLELELNGWPATITALRGAERRRTPEGFAEAEWTPLDAVLAPLSGLALGKGAAQQLTSACGAHRPLRDALLQLSPALIQCRASFPDKWLNGAMTTPAHDGLIGMPDSCYMWRRGGALETIRAERAAKR